MTLRSGFSTEDDRTSFWRLSQDLPLVLIYKHSTRCFVSTSARARIDKLVVLRPDLPILQVDVIAERELSREISRRWAIVHESPQAILVREGQPVWHASHSGVTVEAVTHQL